jgi:predicted double-glycine peptidase
MNCSKIKQIIPGMLILGILNFTSISTIALPTSYRTIRYQEIVGQTSYYTCGPAAVATLLIYYYGIDTSEKEILELSHQAIKERGQDPEEGKGIDALALQKTLEDKGIPSKGIKIPSENLPKYFNDGGLPIILHVTKPQLHYILAIGIVGSWVVIADPSWGRKIIHLNDLIDDKGFEGITLIPLTPKKLLNHVRRQQNNNIIWAKNRLYRLGKGVAN